MSTEIAFALGAAAGFVLAIGVLLIYFFLAAYIEDNTDTNNPTKKNRLWQLNYTECSI